MVRINCSNSDCAASGQAGRSPEDTQRKRGACEEASGRNTDSLLQNESVFQTKLLPKWVSMLKKKTLKKKTNICRLWHHKQWGRKGICDQCSRDHQLAKKLIFIYLLWHVSNELNADEKIKYLTNIKETLENKVQILSYLWRGKFLVFEIEITKDENSTRG